MSDLKSTVTTFSTKSVNEKYQKKSHLEHIKDLPDTYIGSIEPVTQNMPFYNEETQRMEYADITFIPGLYKIFDEVLVNANDHKIRCPDLKNIKVTIDKASGKIGVWNDGSGIDVELHESGVYAPELIFGHLLTSGNYDAAEKKLTGGKNGYGAKLANIFSSSFRVETVDDVRGKKYIQEFTNNMTVVGAPKITSCKNKPYVLIEFIPDFARFKIAGLTDDIIKVFTKRIYDLSATTKDVNIFLNEKKLPVRNFEKYMELYIGNNKKEFPRVYQEVSERWEVGACTSPDGSFQHISFANGIWTYKGGKHVDYVADQFSRRVTKYINEKKKKLNVKESYVKSNIWVFVRCLVENPSFSSQTKEELTTISKNFGSKCEVSDDFIEKLAKSGVMDKAVELTAFKEKDSLKKTDGKKRFTIADIPKLDDANKAGGAESYKCTLILTEGDSAKASAISGLSVVGRDYYGVFPLKGKLLNVREATNVQLLNNEEIKQIKNILGLQHYEKDSSKAKVYTDVKELRYGRVLIMTDADVDGSHIKGLLVNFFHYHWPSLLKIQNFFDVFKTPLVTASKKLQKLRFYSLNEYEEWKKATPSNSTWEIKYYKGLGTSTAEEFKEYFREMTKNLVHFRWTDDETDDNAITLAFKKERTNDRKDWLNEYNADPHHGLREIHSNTPSFSDFIHKELIHFSNYDNIRSVPVMMDGLKPSQRKVIYSAFKRNLKKEIKVSQFSGYVSEQTSYHHGETSLQGTIVGLAQDFVGSNNMNLLVPKGQFGTRIKGGDDAASSRYIFTYLSPVTFSMFDENDFPLLNYLDDDGMKIEPVSYYPILPMVLINGTDGIGTGFRSKIPCYNPFDVFSQIQSRLIQQSKDESFDPFQAIHPWYNKFEGTIDIVDESNKELELEDDESVDTSDSGDFRKYVATGKYQILGDTIKITELPVGVWTQNYKEFIENSLLEHCDTEKEIKKDQKSVDSGGKKEKKIRKKYNLPINSYDNHCTDEKVNFSIKMEKGFLAALSHTDILKRFKLTKSISTSSMYLYNNTGSIYHYKTPEEIMEEFYTVRLTMYQTRKEYLLNKIMRECIILENKVKFVQSVLDEKIKWNQTEEAINNLLEKLTINRLDVDEFNLGIDLTTRVPLADSKVSYHYVLDMKIRSLTKEKVDALQKDYDEKRVEYDLLDKKKITDMWLDDLTALQKVYKFNTVIAPASAPLEQKKLIIKVIDQPKKKLLVKKAPVTMDAFVSGVSQEDETLSTMKKKLIIKKPITMDAFVTDSSQLKDDDSEDAPLSSMKKKLIIKK